MVDRRTEQTVGFGFLGLMVIFLILALTTFEGDVTVMLIIVAVVFLVVALFLLGGTGSGSGGSGQQQSVVLDGGRAITQQSGGVLTVCSKCSARVPEQARFCPDCGNALGG